MKVTLKIDCTHEQLQEVLADWCDRWARDEKPDDWDLDESNSQRALERGSEVAGGVMRVDAANRRDPSTKSITEDTRQVNERAGK